MLENLKQFEIKKEKQLNILGGTGGGGGGQGGDERDLNIRKELRNCGWEDGFNSALCLS